jgi:hypothetical protein
MRFSPAFRIGVLSAAVVVCVPGQTTPPVKDAQSESKGLPPRATPADYQVQAQAGAVTIAAEFTGHAVPTEQGPFSTEDYVAVETGLFGPPGARITLSASDFSLRINGKKVTLPSQQYGLVFASLKDPSWQPPKPAESKSKASIGSNDQADSSVPPAPVKMPFELQRAMTLHVQRAALPEGDRALPVAGVIFFRYRGQDKNIHSVELMYAGPAGTAKLDLQ